MRAASGSLSELGLIGLIRRGFARPRGGGVELGIGDDCAILNVRRGSQVVVTTDLMVEGQHFRKDLHSAESVGHRCIARGLSDIAAMGADPVAAFLSLGLPKSMLKAQKKPWLMRFLDGFRRLSDGSGVVLAGGDTGEVLGEAMVADVVVVGQAPKGTALRRSGARIGDCIYVTGALGGAAAELERMMAGQGRLARRQEIGGMQPGTYPEPRLRVGAALRRRGLASACIDVSDGLSTDLGHVCEASGVGAEVWAAAVPVHALAEGPERLRLALDGGEDYELLFTASGVVPRRIAGVPVTRIGEVVRRRGMTLVGADGERSTLEAGGWEHFRG